MWQEVRKRKKKRKDKSENETVVVIVGHVCPPFILLCCVVRDKILCEFEERKKNDSKGNKCKRFS